MTCDGFNDSHSVTEQENEGWVRPAILIAVGGIAWALIFAAAKGYGGRPSGFTTIKLSLAVIAFAGACRFMRTSIGSGKRVFLTQLPKSA